MMAKKSINEGHNESTKIALLEQSIGHINESLRDIKDELKLDRGELKKYIDKMDSKFDAQNSKMDSHFRWTLLFIFGLYGIVITSLISAIGKTHNWF